MAFGKKKTEPESFSPEGLDKLSQKTEQTVEKARNRSPFERVSDRFHARRDSKEIARTVKWKRRVTVILVCTVIVLLVLYIISLLLTQWGDLVIDVDSGAAQKGLSISEHADLSDPKTRLDGSNVDDVTNITYDWFFRDFADIKELDEGEGEHNGKNYVAYTFYVTNSGRQTLDYNSLLKIRGVAKSADEACRIMIFKNGEPTVYAKENTKFNPDYVFEDIVDKLFSGSVVFNINETGLEPGKADKYTIVIWIEGEDPECINDIMGGHIRMSWYLSLPDENATTAPTV